MGKSFKIVEMKLIKNLLREELLLYEPSMPRAGAVFCKDKRL